MAPIKCLHCGGTTWIVKIGSVHYEHPTILLECIGCGLEGDITVMISTSIDVSGSAAVGGT